ncbi:uncharacterized protein LOC126686864 [Mercurialis annua]|uniref:uncharacterized protein LOC126686864 n=1 Tax=Mercurialis annua TaxID=3986 RepID=UPI0024AD16D2|nr:uncharacterized protein LOC126686864 [Mercurialis annua]
MALSLSSAMFIVCFSIFVLAGDALRDVPEQASMPNTTLSQDIPAGEYIQVANIMGFLQRTNWTGDCFQDNTAWVTKNRDFSTGWIIVETDNEISHTCTESYEFMIGSQVIAARTIYVSGRSRQEIQFSPTAEQKRELHAAEKQEEAPPIYQNGLHNENGFISLSEIGSSSRVRGRTHLLEMKHSEESEEDPEDLGEEELLDESDVEEY